MLLRNLGNGDLDDLTMTFAEKFICRVYNVSDAESSCNEARAKLFFFCRSPEVLPPTSDAAWLHIRRAHFQAMIWKQAQLTNATLPLPETMGWSRLNDKLVPIADVSCSCTWKLMVMVIILHLYSAFFIWIYSNALYNTFWGTLPDCIMAQLTIFFNLISRIHRCPQNGMSDDRPQHRELHALLFTNTVCVFFNVPQLF